MQRRATLLIALLIPIAGLFLWLAFGLKPDVSTGDRSLGPTGPLRVGSGVESHGELAAPPKDALAPAPVTAARTRAEPRDVGTLDPLLDPELRVASWVEGRVEFAANTPPDEVAFVVARGREFEARPLYRGKVGPDGRFRVAFSKGTRVGWLQISARYNFLSQELAVRPASPPDDIVLKGTLGGLVRGRISVPTDGLEFLADMLAGDVSAGEFPFDFFALGRTRGSIAEDLSYEIGGIEAAAERNVMLKARGFVPLSVSGVEVEAGRVKILDLAPELGLRVLGRVVDESGAPVVEARVSPSYRGEIKPQFLFGSGSVTTDEDGRFRLVGLAPGDLAVIVQKSGFEPLVHALGPRASGALIADLALVLSQGQVITGRVLYGADHPAARALVSAESESEGEAVAQNRGDYDRSSIAARDPVETAFDGTFRLSGLSPGMYSVTAQAWGKTDKEEAAQATEDETGVRSVRRIGTPYSARADRVASGTTDLVITLTSGETIRGRVVDSDGKPVERFVVSAWPDAASEGYSDEIKNIERAFRDKGGRFALPGLRACGWTVNVRAKGYLDGEAVKLASPGASPDLRFKLLKLARLSGVVTDPDHKPVAQAKVVCRSDSSQWWSGSTTARTNDKGEFTLTQVPLGPVRVHAEANGFVRGDPLRFELGSGVARAGLELTVVKGATIRGVVRKSDGTPDVERLVNASEIDGTWDKSSKTDAQGEFVFDGLAPGRYKLETRAESSREWFGSGTLERVEDSAGPAPETARTSVRVNAGETVSVTLAAKSTSAIRMHGVIAGKGRKPATIQAAPLGGAAGRRSARAAVSPDGKYELRLSGPGTYRITIAEDSERGSSIFSVSVPDVASFETDFTLPTGSISGRVITADDAPVKDHRVRVTRTSSRDLHDTTNSREAVTGEDGAFEIAWLSDGEYNVETLGTSQWWERDAAGGRAPRETVTIAAGKPVADLQLVLGEGGVVKGSVRSSGGELMPNAEVFLFDENGHAISQGHTIESSTVGGFHFTGIPVGKVHVYARTTHSAGRTTALVREDAPAQIDVVLRPRADLTVLVTDATGAPVFAALELTDDAGCHHEEIAPFDRDLEPAPGARSFASLPAGRFTIRAFLPGGATLEKSAAITEGGRADVVLR
ncbi:MAG: carboxypeptidase regulatory-like domain-containing protein [Planctomycetes bacterium]|nr:carboxypeptidase regulatory-like domain-containing protein [Planctomycetota bacterium]